MVLIFSSTTAVTFVNLSCFFFGPNSFMYVYSLRNCALVVSSFKRTYEFITLLQKSIPNAYMGIQMLPYFKCRWRMCSCFNVFRDIGQ